MPADESFDDLVNERRSTGFMEPSMGTSTASLRQQVADAVYASRQLGNDLAAEWIYAGWMDSEPPTDCTRKAS